MKNLKQKPFFLALFLSLVVNLVLLSDKYLPQIFKQKKGYTITVNRVVDGDTLISHQGDYIRLAGINAPEYPTGCLSLAAKKRLEELVLGKTIRLEMVKKDNFGRVTAFVFLDNVLINNLLVKEGLAKVTDDNLDYSPSLVKAEQEAKTVKNGLWSSACSQEKSCLIKGNTRKDKGTKIYHLPECFNYEKIVIDESEGDRWFCAENEAQKAGFSKSKDCPES